MALLALALVIAAIAYQLRQPDSYAQSVLSLSGDTVQGQVIFEQNCAGCHGIDANGIVGPNLHHVGARKSNIRLIHQVVSGETPPMPQFQPTPQEMADLLEYLKSL